MTRDEAALVAALDAEPGDALARAALADLMEEAGKAKEAAGHRWMAENGKGPGRAGVWVWRDEERYQTLPPDRLAGVAHSLLPSRICRLLPRAQGPGFYAFPARAAAEAALLHALVTLGLIPGPGGPTP